MNLSLPSKLVTAIAEVKKPDLHFISPDKVWLYTASSPDFFNAIASDRLALLYAKYNFNPPEHEDWVHPTILYSVGNGVQSEEQGNSFHPLNSIYLKNPIAFVPSFEEMLQFADHIHMLAKNKEDKTVRVLDAEEIHDNYVERVCLQLQYCESLLQSWVDLGRPREQEECIPLPSPVEVRKTIIAQKQNVEAVKGNYYNLRRNLFPQFVLDRYFAIFVREEKILDELRKVSRRLK